MTAWLVFARCNGGRKTVLPKQNGLLTTAHRSNRWSRGRWSEGGTPVVVVMVMMIVVVVVVVTHRSPFGCTHCQPNHRVGLKFVIASVTPCVITLRAGCQGNSCNCSGAQPHATYHTIMCTMLGTTMYHISPTTLYNAMYHTIICRIQCTLYNIQYCTKLLQPHGSHTMRTIPICIPHHAT